MASAAAETSTTLPPDLEMASRLQSLTASVSAAAPMAGFVSAAAETTTLPPDLEMASCPGGLQSLTDFAAAASAAKPSWICISRPSDVEPTFEPGIPYMMEQENKSALLAMIGASYDEARSLLHLLPTERGDMVRCFPNGAFCFGLLDPANSIVFNALAAYWFSVDDSSTPSAEDPDLQLERTKQRSLNGLVAFLICLFPYLDEHGAVCYLLRSRADLLVAAHLVVKDRGIETRFNVSSDAASATFKTALRCAALAAEHTMPDHLVDTWLSLSSHVEQFQSLLANLSTNVGKTTAAADTHSVYMLWEELLQFTMPLSPPSSLHCPLNPMVEPWLSAGSRFNSTEVPYEHYHFEHNQSLNHSLKRVLLDTIHAMYLKALARLPAGELRSRYHRSMLLAGHCYGPMDPVSNIIINTLWFDAKLPPSQNLELDTISTRSLFRIEARSFCGLLSFLRTRYPDLSAHEAMRCLIHAGANLLSTDHDLDGAAGMGENRLLHHSVNNPDLYRALRKVNQAPCTSVLEAFKAAATAARHPNPDAQGELLSKCKPAMLGHHFSALLPSRGLLSSEDVRFLANLLSCNTPDQLCSVPKYKITRSMDDRIEVWIDEHAKISKKVKAVLNTYNLQNEGSMYELHVICAVNKEVSGPEYCDDRDENDPFIFRHTHVNFLATPKGEQHAGSRAPMLFFAELCNDEDDEAAHPLCCPVSSPLESTELQLELVRCIYCEHEGIKIVHPAKEKFQGRELEFEKMVMWVGKQCWDNLEYTNDNILCHGEVMVDRVERIAVDDCIYCGVYYGSEEEEGSGSEEEEGSGTEEEDDDYGDYVTADFE